jgi:hypothetical protein
LGAHTAVPNIVLVIEKICVRLYTCGWVMVGLRDIDEPVRLPERLEDERLEESSRVDAGLRLVMAENPAQKV